VELVECCEIGSEIDCCYDGVNKALTPLSSICRALLAQQVVQQAASLHHRRIMFVYEQLLQNARKRIHKLNNENT